MAFFSLHSEIKILTPSLYRWVQAFSEDAKPLAVLR
ncbi:hypothetical protein EVA_06231 [gut metagenome]|uniref:Uncharacterized protein n=1 Tax=gut metagenome TaxID=749906 RepID=J9GFF3_9ZZZZ